jgi:hypothetical protein
LTSHVQHGHRRRLAAPTEWHVKWVQRGVRARLCRTAALALAGAVLAGCGGGSGDSEDGSPPAAPASVEREIAPADTDAAIVNTAATGHIAINPEPAAAARGRLFVFLPGTGATPAQYRDVLRTGARRGYHAIGLQYPNASSVASLCNRSTAPDCHGPVRREVVLGEDLSTLVDVDAANAIVNRLRKALAYLHAQSPAQGWDRFLVAGEPDWRQITVAGHSQGAGHSAYMAKLFALDRAVYFSGPSDWREAAGQTATWLTALAPATPASRQYGFTHTDDTLVSVSVVTANWRALGLGAFGEAVNVDAAAAPWNGGHSLLTSAPPNPNPTGITLAPTHGAPVADAPTPRAADGTPLYSEVWSVLCFP